MKNCLELPSFFVDVSDEEVEYIDGKGFSWAGFFLMLSGIAACFIGGLPGIIVGVVLCVAGFVLQSLD